MYRCKLEGRGASMIKKRIAVPCTLRRVGFDPIITEGTVLEGVVVAEAVDSAVVVITALIEVARL